MVLEIRSYKKQTLNISHEFKKKVRESEILQRNRNHSTIRGLDKCPKLSIRGRESKMSKNLSPWFMDDP